MILLRGDPTRSGKLDSYFAAEEFRLLVKSLQRIVDKGKAHDLGADEVKRQSENLSEKLKTVERYIDSDDSDFQSAIEGMATDLNNLSRSLQKKDSDYHKRSARTSYERFLENYKKAVERMKIMQETLPSVDEE